jgi:hypothetical protein
MTNNILPSAFILLSLFSLIFVYPMIMLSFLINKLFKRFKTIKALDKISNFKQAVLIASILNLTLLNIFKKAWFLYPTYIIFFLFSSFLEENWKAYRESKEVKYLMSCFAFLVIATLFSSVIFMFFETAKAI